MAFTILRRGRGWLVLLSLFFFVGYSYGQRGAITRQVTLEELATRADTIVHGYVIGSRVEPMPQHPGLNTVVVDVKVVDLLKGEAGQRLTFRQFIWDVRDRDDAAGYRKGQEVVLLLAPASRLGLRSPEGLEQGRFTIERLKNGETRAVNGTGNVFLFAESEVKGTGPSVQRAVPEVVRQNPRNLSLETLKQAIRAYAGGAQ